MVIFFDSTGTIQAVEHNVMSPKLPANTDIADKIGYYNEQGLHFICLNYELGSDVLDYKVILEENGDFKALQPIERK